MGEVILMFNLNDKVDAKHMTVAAATTTILIWIVSLVPPQIEIPGEVGAALTLVIGFLFGRFLPSKK